MAAAVQLKPANAGDGSGVAQTIQDNRTGAGGYCDDSLVKLANQEEEFRLATTMDSLHTARSRSSANMAYERHRVDKTLRTLKSQRNLMDKARVDNVFTKRRRPVSTATPEKQSKPCKSELHVNFADQKSSQEADGMDFEANFDPAVSNAHRHHQRPKTRSSDGGITAPPPLSRPAFMRQRSSSTPPDPVSVADFRVAPNRTYTPPPTSRRPHPRSKIRSSKQQESRELRIVHDVSVEDLESDSGGGGGCEGGSDETLYEIKWKNIEIPERPNSRPKSSKQFPSLSTGGGGSGGGRPRTRSMSSVKRSTTPEEQDRPQTASAALLFGRSRRELTRLTHIDAIAAADLELRRRMWFSQLAHQKEIEEAKLKERIDRFISNVEGDKKKLRGSNVFDNAQVFGI